VEPTMRKYWARRNLHIVELFLPQLLHVHGEEFQTLALVCGEIEIDALIIASTKR
jgi:hypothetical protein